MSHTVARSNGQHWEVHNPRTLTGCALEIISQAGRLADPRGADRAPEVRAFLKLATRLAQSVQRGEVTAADLIWRGEQVTFTAGR